ncbi:MAG TPA: Ig-like domain-containing protein [Bradyrhizobium sp.]|nr:Ig-like domain-containing protein [Bradyrhizobium sp.]
MAIPVVKIGSEFLVNSQTVGNQSSSNVTSLANGNFLVTWQDQMGDNSGYGIKAQIFAADGSRIGSEFLVNSLTFSHQSAPTAAGLASGGFVVTWQHPSGDSGNDKQSDVEAQIFAADGTRIGPEFTVNTQRYGSQGSPAVTGLSNGNFVVTWGSDIDRGGAKAQIFAADGSAVGAEFFVKSRPFEGHYGPEITSLANGGFVVTWSEQHAPGDASGLGVVAQIFAADGSRVGLEFLVNTQTPSTQTRPTITGLANGGFVITWLDGGGLSGEFNLSRMKAQVFAADGSKLGPEILVNPQAAQFAQSTVAALDNGDFVIAWSHASAIRAQVFAADGRKLGTDFSVDAQATGVQAAPSITALGDRGFVLTWWDNSGTLGDASGTSIKAQIFTWDTTPPAAPTIGNSSVIGGFVNAAGNTAAQSLSGTAEAESSIEVYLNGSATPAYTTLVGSDGNWSVQLGHLADGNYSYTAVVTDVAGNRGTPSAAMNFVVDTITSFPEVTSIASEGPETVTVSGTVNFADTPQTITIADGRFLPGSDPAAWSATTLTDSSGHWSITGVPWTVFSNSIFVVDTDAAGNVGLSHYVYTGSWVPTGATLDAGDRQFVYGFSSGWIVGSGAEQNVYAGGLADGAVVRGTQINWGNAINTKIDGGTQIVWGSASATTILAGAQYVGGAANGTSIGAGGQQTVYGSGRVSGVAVYGGNQFVWGAADLTTVDNGGLQEVHGSVTHTTIATGKQAVYDGAVATGTTLNDGSVQFAWGAVIDTTINQGGIQYVYGSATCTTINGGTQNIQAGATATDTTINAGGRVHLAGNGAINNVIFGQPGGTLELWSSNSSGPISGFASGDKIYVLDMPTTHLVYAPNADNSGGTLQVLSSAIGFNNKVASLELLGQYAAGDFLVAHDVSSGQAYVTTTHVDAIPLVTPSQS